MNGQAFLNGLFGKYACGKQDAGVRRICARCNGCDKNIPMAKVSGTCLNTFSKFSSRLSKPVVSNRLAEKIGECGLHGVELDAVLRTLGTRQGGANGRKVE